MSTEVGAIHYTLDLDDKNFKKGAKEASSSFDSIADRADKSVEASKGFTKAFMTGMAVVGAAAVGFGVKSVQAFQESETALAQLNAVLKSTGGAVGYTAGAITDMATELEHLTGVSDEAVIAGQSMLLTFTNIRGRAFKGATEAVLDMATAMNGGAIPSAEAMRDTAIQVGKALNDPITGYTKLQRVGVTFTEAQIKQIEAMTKANNVAGAQNVILQELQKEFGGSAKAAGQTFTGQMNIAKETFGDFMELVGGSIVKVLQPLVKAFNNWMQAMGGPEGVMEALITKFKELQKWVDQHRLLIITLAGAIGGPLVVAFTAWAIAAAQAAIATIIALAPVMILGAAIAALAYIIYTNWTNIVTWTQNSVAAVVGFFTNLWQSLVSIAQSIWDTVLPIIEGFWVAITLPFRIGYAIIYGIFYGLWEFCKWIWGMIGDSVITAVNWMWSTITKPFIDGFNFIKGILNAIWDVNVMIWTKVGGFFVNMYSTIKNAITKPFTDAKDAVSGVLDGMIKVVGGWFDSLKNIMLAPVRFVVTNINKLINAYNQLPGTPDIPVIPGFANGVRNFTGGMAVVGERGPELVELPRGSSVYSNEESKGMMGSPTFTFNITGIKDREMAKMIGEELGKQFIQSLNGTL